MSAAVGCCPRQGLLLEDIRFVDAKDAVTIVARKQPWVSPAEIIAEVKKMRRKRIDEFGPITPPADLDPDDTAAYREWWANVQRAIADGDLKPQETWSLQTGQQGGAGHRRGTDSNPPDPNRVRLCLVLQG